MRLKSPQPWSHLRNLPTPWTNLPKDPPFARASSRAKPLPSPSPSASPRSGRSRRQTPPSRPRRRQARQGRGQGRRPPSRSSALEKAPSRTTSRRRRWRTSSASTPRSRKRPKTSLKRTCPRNSDAITGCLSISDPAHRGHRAPFGGVAQAFGQGRRRRPLGLRPEHGRGGGINTFDRDFALSLVSSEQEALSEIDGAIKRIRNGTYGICEITREADREGTPARGPVHPLLGRGPEGDREKPLPEPHPGGHLRRAGRGGRQAHGGRRRGRRIADRRPDSDVTTDAPSPAAPPSPASRGARVPLAASDRRLGFRLGPGGEGLDRRIRLPFGTYGRESGAMAVIPDFFYIVHVGNTGAAWSQFSGRSSLLAALAFATLIAIFFGGAPWASATGDPGVLRPPLRGRCWATCRPAAARPRDRLHRPPFRQLRLPHLQRGRFRNLRRRLPLPAAIAPPPRLTAPLTPRWRSARGSVRAHFSAR